MQPSPEVNLEKLGRFLFDRVDRATVTHKVQEALRADKNVIMFDPGELLIEGVGSLATSWGERLGTRIEFQAEGGFCVVHNPGGVAEHAQSIREWPYLQDWLKQSGIKPAIAFREREKFAQTLLNALEKFARQEGIVWITISWSGGETAGILW